MALNLEAKKQIVEEVAVIAREAYSAVAAEYKGVTVGELEGLRTEARKAGVYLRVVKNSLARRAVQETDFECMGDSMKGQLIIAFSMEDPGSAARVINDFTKTNSKLVVQLVSIGGKLLPATDIVTLAKMPTYDQSISMLMSVMKAPVEKLVRTLAEPHAKMVRTVAAVRDQKESA